MRPDRIIIGEVRGSEAFDMLNAMNTGHEGSLSTVHANTPRDALARIENMVLMASLELPDRAIREQMASALHLIIQLSAVLGRCPPRDSRHGSAPAWRAQIVTLQDLFKFEQTSVDEDGKIHGKMDRDRHPPDLRRDASSREASSCPRASVHASGRS